MRLTRFLDPAGQEHHGHDRGDGTAELLSGDLFFGLSLTGATATIHQRLAPLRPVNLFCIGKNYAAHAKETGSDAPESPIVFMKPTSAVTDPDHPILIPHVCQDGTEVDYEAELAVVIGRVVRDVPQAEALDYVFGYTCANDISARKWQLEGGGGQWIRGKGFDTFCPLGPVLVTADEIPDPQNLAVKLILNGEMMQCGVTSDMIFTVAKLISFLSRDTTLLPGTVILTGTPAGVGFTREPPVYLKDGDQVVVEIEGIGRLSNPVLSWMREDGG